MKLLYVLAICSMFVFYPTVSANAQCVPPSADGCVGPDGTITNEVIPTPDTPPESFDVVLTSPPTNVLDDIPNKEEHRKMENKPPKSNCYPYKVSCW